MIKHHYIIIYIYINIIKNCYKSSSRACRVLSRPKNRIVIAESQSLYRFLQLLEIYPADPPGRCHEFEHFELGMRLMRRRHDVDKMTKCDTKLESIKTFGGRICTNSAGSYRVNEPPPDKHNLYE